ncbi:MAG: hypothetical protein AAF581_05480 [Planctomycetota bacterium]
MAPPSNRRRPRPDGDGPPQFAKKKTVKMNPVVGIFLFVTPVILLIVVITLWINKNAPKEQKEQTKVEKEVTWDDKFIKDLGKVRKMWQAAMKHRTDEDQTEYRKLWNAANEAALDLKEVLDKNLEDYKNEDGELLPDYDGYNEHYVRLTELRHDLIKSEPLGF